MEADEEEKEEVCETCGGEGSILIASSCMRPMSECCGGCSARCPDCNAKPEQEYNSDDEYDKQRERDQEDALRKI